MIKIGRFVNRVFLVNSALTAIFLWQLSAAMASCSSPASHPEKNRIVEEMPSSLGDTVSDLGADIGCIFQDKLNRYWFASNGGGVYCYDGQFLIQYTSKDGLISDFVLNIRQDATGKIWFTTRDGFGSFDGIRFKDETLNIRNALPGKCNAVKEGIYFNTGDGVCYTDGTKFIRFQIFPASYTSSSADNNRPFSIYSTYVDKAGDVWFGTQSMGVCRYDGTAFSYLTELDLEGPAVRTIFQDRSGVMWFGNNGGGLFRYDGKTLRNITRERGLENPAFLKEGRPVDKPGSLARVFTINEDKNGSLWIGTIDAGLWKFDGVHLTNYTTKDGLPGNSIWYSYKDNAGDLWFVVDGMSIVRCNGKGFKKFQF